MAINLTSARPLHQGCFQESNRIEDMIISREYITISPCIYAPHKKASEVEDDGVTKAKPTGTSTRGICPSSLEERMQARSQCSQEAHTCTPRAWRLTTVWGGDISPLDKPPKSMIYHAPQLPTRDDISIVDLPATHPNAEDNTLHPAGVRALFECRRAGNRKACPSCTKHLQSKLKPTGASLHPYRAAGAQTSMQPRWRPGAASSEISTRAYQLFITAVRIAARRQHPGSRHRSARRGSGMPGVRASIRFVARAKRPRLWDSDARREQCAARALRRVTGPLRERRAWALPPQSIAPGCGSCHCLLRTMLSIRPLGSPSRAAPEARRHVTAAQQRARSRRAFLADARTVVTMASHLSMRQAHDTSLAAQYGMPTTSRLACDAGGAVAEGYGGCGRCDNLGKRGAWR
ncbi:hypothetical protein FB451DRAFT_1369875 [Mycena latifolia]|nr:hypothetical protein FB451DRAFT_1369875 [Mycena latifolia]